MRERVVSLDYAGGLWQPPWGGYSTSMAEETRYREHVLFVTGPERRRLYRHFSAIFHGRDDVEVRMDRRVEERRRAGLGPGNGERRARDRRKRPPEWMVPPGDGI